jgi:cytochrome c biogenesis protein
MTIGKNLHRPGKMKAKKSEPKKAMSLLTPVPLAQVGVVNGLLAEEVISPLEAAPQTAAKIQRRSIIDAVLGLLSSVPFGLALLVGLILACMIGMLIQQQELESFAKYYATLTPAEKLVYGSLGFFNIYHTWYFNALLLLLSLNIILSSIDHFPKAWSLFRRKKLTASPDFAQAQRVHETVKLPGAERNALVARASHLAKAARFKVQVTEREGRTTIFAERGAWNRLGAYAVHVALLLIFLGGYLTAKYGHTGGMWLQPGHSADKMVQQVYSVDGAANGPATREVKLQLPFEVECLEVQQKLIDKTKFIDAMNTIDWLTRIRIKDETGEREALVHLNKPYDYRGYRFFQSSFQAVGSARTINLRLTPEGGGSPQNIALKLNEETALADGTRLRYFEFNPDFQMGQHNHPSMASGEYNNPAAHLEITKPNGERSEAWAFTENYLKAINEAPFLKSASLASNGWQITLTDFEKAALAHMLSVQYDPGISVVYLGFLLLCLTLVGVFFFAHQRLWMVVEDGQVHLGGDTNRNRLVFEDKVRKMAAALRDPQSLGAHASRVLASETN